MTKRNHLERMRKLVGPDLTRDTINTTNGYNNNSNISLSRCSVNEEFQEEEMKYGRKETDKFKSVDRLLEITKEQISENDSKSSNSLIRENKVDIS